MKKGKEKKYGLLSNILYVYKGVAKHKPYLIGLLVLSVFCNAGSRFIWLFLGKYLLEYIGQGMPVEELIRMVIILTAGNIICMIGQNAVNFGKEPAAFYVRPMFMLERNKKSIDLFYEKLEDRKVMDAMERSREATRNVDVGIEGIIRFTIDLSSHIFTCILAVFLLCRISIPLVIAVLVVGLLSYISTDKVTKKEKILTNDEVLKEKRELEYFKRISSDFAYGKDIRLFRAGDRLIRTQKDLQVLMNKKVCRAKKLWILSGLFNDLMDLLREGSLYALLVYMILNGSLGIGDFLLYSGCVRNLADAFGILMKTLAKLRKCSSEVNDYRKYNELCDEEEHGGSEVSEAGKYVFTFENVSFRYPGRDDYALKDINLTVESGEKLAVVGLNGAGKTTFVKLLLKLYQPTEGRILLNGKDIKEIRTDSYYDIFAPVFQDMECYAFSLAENVSMRIKEETDDKLAAECLKKAGLGKKLESLEKGVDTPVLRVLHNDGLMLSGGEKQKLALARALYKDAPFVVLDEPTAALDARAESETYERFNSFAKDKSAVFVSHRLASTRFCDRIAMFENGKIVEYGSHKDLMDKEGKYAKMFELQAQYYQEEEENESVDR